MAEKSAKLYGAFAWTAFAFNTLFSTLFAVLAWFTFTEFKRVSKDPVLVAAADVRPKDWVALFRGAAVSAFFSVLLVILFVIQALYYMLFSRKSLAHPRSKFGRGFLMAGSFMSALHIANIAQQFYSFEPAMDSWVSEFHVSFNTMLLTSTWVFGYISAATFLVFAVMLALWHDTQAEDVEHQILTTARNVA
ncbi:hypothetical protein WJX73_002926 [Symbiochloris irregularis]|uniref:Uncharacterized protein n=1 Tax=Symbiochloris irregularis TaxID=706552 RepID=A0AAW1PI59_9CHLO